jgi:hypothetical protein
MCPACLTAILGTVAGSAGGVGLLVWFRRHSKAKQQAVPPSASFHEWVAAVISLEKSLGAGSSSNLRFASESRRIDPIGRV